jgi:hypothetical protein
MNLHPAMQYELTKARITDLHRQAERDRIARYARQARPPKQAGTGQRGVAIHIGATRRALVALIARSN